MKARNLTSNFEQKWLSKGISNIFTHLNLWQNQAKFVIVHTNALLSTREAKQIAKVFNDFELLNSIVISETDRCLSVHTCDLHKNAFEIKNGIESFNEVFPDKLKDMKGYPLRILVGPQLPRFKIIDGTYESVDTGVLRIMASKTNASLRIIQIDDLTHLQKNLTGILSPIVADLTLVTIIVFKHDPFRGQINTFDEIGYCALIPIPPRLTFLQFLLSPYDIFSWACIFTVSVSCAMLWKFMGKTSMSAWNFGFAVAANFVGQSVKLKCSRRMQVTLLQLCILMTFIIGNAYQSLIIATMTSSREGVRFKSFDELLRSNLNFTTDKFFKNRFQLAEERDLVARIETVDVFRFSSIVATKNAFIAQCDVIHFLFKEQTSHDFAQHFYLLPDQVMKKFEKFLMTFGSPFESLVQKYFVSVFESGIRQNLAERFRRKKLAERQRDLDFLQNETFMLTIDDMYGAFYLLLAGWLFGLLSLVIEILINLSFSCMKLCKKIQPFNLRSKNVND